MAPQQNSLFADSIEGAWKQAVAILADEPRGEKPLLSVAISKDEWDLSVENDQSHALLDSFLVENGFKKVNTTASTIFPSSLWNPTLPREELYRRYMKILPRLRKRGANHYGLYFERMIAYRWTGPGDEDRSINQLEKIIGFYQSGNPRRSALQIAILDPTKDLTNQRQRGFPCLQQVSFSAEGAVGWSVTGYYATQDIIARGYGNYLGLARLGSYVATAVGRRLTRVNCVASVALLGKGITKEAARALLTNLDRGR